MKRKIIPISIALLISSSFLSCKTYRYAKTSFVPLFSKTGDVTINTNISSQQIGFAVSNNLGIFVTNTWNNYRSPLFYTSESELQSKHRSHWASIGIVPYLKGSEHINIAMPTSIGKGLQYNESDGQNDEHSYFIYFIQQFKYISFQPTLSYLIDDKFYLSIFNRSYFSRNKIIRSHDYKALTRTPKFKYDYDAQTMFNYVNQLGINLKFNKNKLDFYFEVSYPLYSNLDKLYRYQYQFEFMSENLSMELGLTYNFNFMGKKFWKKKSKEIN